MRVAIVRIVAAALIGLGATGPADAGWREDLGTFRVGMVAEHGAGATVDGASAIRTLFSQALGMPVEIFVARDFGALIDAQATSRIEYAVYSATAYATAWRLCGCVEALVAPVGADGSIGIRSVLMARDGGPATADEAIGGPIALGPPDSVGASMLPLAQYAPGGGALSGEEDFLVHAATDMEALEMLADGRAGAAFGHVPSSTGEAALPGGSPDRLRALGATDVRILWTSDLLRYGPHAVRRNLNPEAKDALRAALTSLAADRPEVHELLERRHGGGFVEVVHEDYRTAIDLVRSAVSRQAAR